MEKHECACEIVSGKCECGAEERQINWQEVGPELLEAANEAGTVLMAVLESLEERGWADDFPQAFKARQGTVAKLRAVIKKAEGR